MRRYRWTQGAAAVAWAIGTTYAFLPRVLEASWPLGTARPTPGTWKLASPRAALRDAGWRRASALLASSALLPKMVRLLPLLLGREPCSVRAAATELLVRVPLPSCSVRAAATELRYHVRSAQCLWI